MRKLAITALVLMAATGCHMCSSPYDYCGPVVENGPHPQGCATCGNQMGSDYAATRSYNGQPGQSVVSNSQSGGQQGPSIGSNSSTMMR